ncbi:MAG TPA: Crp/Fnr family transcriptional regulator [Thermoanaerobaculia bacterium]|nr:Crp/Fnr family transcriptional regulator [Thermoanaerobaculia bacterium]
MLRGSPYGFECVESCLKCNWHNHSFFCDLDPTALGTFDKVAFINVYPADAVLFSEGLTQRGVFLVCHGSVKLSVSSNDGETLITHTAKEGELLGLSTVFSGRPYISTAETLEPTQVNFIRADHFRKFVGEYGSASFKAAEQLARESESDNHYIRALGLSHSAAEKLSHLLLSIDAEHGHATENGSRVQFLMTHEDVSQVIGTSRETVTRLLTEFRDKGLITIHGSSLTITNRPALEALVLL